MEEEILDLSEENKVCPKCGKPYTEMSGGELSYEVCIRRRRYYLKKVIRRVYMCNCGCGKKFITAKAPAKLIPKRKFSTEVWVELLVNKYQMALPVHRQILQMREEGLEVAAGTIFGGFEKIYFSYIQPLYQALEKHLRKGDRWQADETGWRIFVDVEGKKGQRWFLWCYICKDVVLFVVDPSSSSKVPFKVLFGVEGEQIKGLKEGIVQQGDESRILNADRYSAYKVLQECGVVRIAYCWSHVRRDFTDIITKYSHDKELLQWATQWTERIALLYTTNDKRISSKQGSEEFKKYRQQLKEISDEIYKEACQDYGHPIKNRVMKSIREHWHGLVLFFKDPKIPIDNNLYERTIRLSVLGRNNYWGNHSIWSRHFSADMVSIILTCLINGISSKAYLNYYLSEFAKRASATSEDEIDNFLLHNLKNSLEDRMNSPDG